MKNSILLAISLLLLFTFTKCDFEDDLWDPNNYIVVVLDGNTPFYDFKTAKALSDMPENIDNYGLINEAWWCTDLPAICGNYQVTNETSFSAFTAAPSSGYENDCKNIELNKVLVFKLGDGTYGLVKIVDDVYTSTQNECIHKITLHINYPAFTGTSDDDEDKKTVFNNGIGKINEKGGTITVSDQASPLHGVSIEIPEGALTTEVEISINQVESDFVMKEVEPNSFWIKMEPSGTHFEKPVRIGLPYNKGTGLNPDEICMFWSDGEGGAGEVPLFEVDKTNKIVYGGLEHFTYFGLTTILGASKLSWVIDSRDESPYIAVKIGSQSWLTSDVHYNVPGSKPCNDNDSLAAIYGRLYTWQQAKSACPAGYRLPSRDDWYKLEKEMGMTDQEVLKVDGIRTWTEITPGLQSLGFNIYLIGIYSDNNLVQGFNGFGDYAYYWTSTESYANQAWAWVYINGQWFFLPMADVYQSDYLSVRCVK